MQVCAQTHQVLRLSRQGPPTYGEEEVASDVVVRERVLPRGKVGMRPGRSHVGRQGHAELGGGEQDGGEQGSLSGAKGDMDNV